MSKEELLKNVASGRKISEYIEFIDNNDLIVYLFNMCEDKKNRLKYQAEKVIRELSIYNPKILYPYFERMLHFLNGDNKFLRYGFLLTMPNLLCVDLCNKWAYIRATYLKFYNSNNVIEFNNCVKGFKEIIKTHREEELIVIPILLDIDNHEFKTEKCIEIAKNTVLECFFNIYESSNHKEEIMKFVKDNINSNTPTIRNSVQRFLKKYDK